MYVQVYAVVVTASGVARVYWYGLRKYAKHVIVEGLGDKSTCSEITSGVF